MGRDLCVYEFLYRGWPPDSGKEPGHHVQFWRRMTDGKGNKKWILDPEPKSMAEAAAEGWDIASILGEVAAEALLQVAALKAERDEMQQRQVELEDRVHRAEAALANAVMDRERMMS